MCRFSYIGLHITHTVRHVPAVDHAGPKLKKNAFERKKEQGRRKEAAKPESHSHAHSGAFHFHILFYVELHTDLIDCNIFIRNSYM